MVRRYWTITALITAVLIFMVSVLLIEVGGHALKTTLANNPSDYLSYRGQVTDPTSPASFAILHMNNPFSLLQDGPFTLLKIKLYQANSNPAFIGIVNGAVQEYIAGAWLMIFIGPVLIGLMVIAALVWILIMKFRVLYFNQQIIKITGQKSHHPQLASVEQQKVATAEQEARRQAKAKLVNMLEKVESATRQHQLLFNNPSNRRQQLGLQKKGLLHAQPQDWIYQHVESLKPGDLIKFRNHQWFVVKVIELQLKAVTTFQVRVTWPKTAENKSIIIQKPKHK